MHAPLPPPENPDVFYKFLHSKQVCGQVTAELAKDKRGESVKVAFYCVGERNEKLG